MNLLLIYATLAVAGAAVAMWRQPPLPRSWPLLALAAMPQLLSLLAVRGMILFAVTTVALAVWCWRNWSLPGVALVTVGIALNLLVMGLHGGSMPVHSDTLASMGYAVPSGAMIYETKDLVVQEATLGWLGDWIVLDWLPVRLVVSPGDLVVLVGIVRWLLAGQGHVQQTATA